MPLSIDELYEHLTGTYVWNSPEACARVTTRARGSVPHCTPAEASFHEFDAYEYWSSVSQYCKQIRRYIKHMDEVRAGLVKQPDTAA